LPLSRHYPQSDLRSQLAAAQRASSSALGGLGRLGGSSAAAASGDSDDEGAGSGGGVASRDAMRLMTQLREEQGRSKAAGEVRAVAAALW
jgi:hypothetical protein